ncbi:MAG: hypothetical protein NVS4B8_06600 [Herpetosiphon sp.]
MDRTNAAQTKTPAPRADTEQAPPLAGAHSEVGNPGVGVYDLDAGHGELHLPPLKEGWSRPRPLPLPEPTYAPAIMGMGVVFIFWGILTTFIISALGLVLFIFALIQWIGELRHDN